MFNTKYGPMSIIIRFIPINIIYSTHLNILNSRIYQMISRDIHLRKKSKKISISYIQDMILNKVVTTDQLSNILIYLDYKWIKKHCFFNILKKLLKDKRVDLSIKKNKCIRHCARYGLTCIVQYLLEDPRVDPTLKDNYAFIYAVQENHINVVRLLLMDRRVDPESKDNYAIRHSCESGFGEIVELLLSSGRVDPTVQNNYSIRFACKFGHLDIVKKLLSDPRVDPNAYGKHALYSAMASKHQKIVEILLLDPRMYLKEKKKIVSDLIEEVRNDGTVNVDEYTIDDSGVTIEGHMFDDFSDNYSFEDFANSVHIDNVYTNPVDIYTDE